MSASEPRPVVVVGAGPAGTSAALALRARGLPVHLLDAGEARPTPPPEGTYIALRTSDPAQWRWQLGAEVALRDDAPGVSPKLRVPGLRAVFDGFAEANRLEAAQGFVLVGALAAGGLSTAWGCGVARFTDAELGPLRGERTALDTAYAEVARRMGLSGAYDDALSEELGVDRWSGPALPLDTLHACLWARRARAPGDLALGRARVAVLGEDRGEGPDARRGCDRSGMCLWGCAGRSTWSAALDLERLRRDPGVVIEAGARVEALEQDELGAWRLAIDGHGGPRTLHARRVLLAAGTLASTRLAWRALTAPPPELSLQSNPMAAFLLVLPGMLGAPRERAFGLAQLSWLLELPDGERAFGNLFSTAGLPVSEFLGHLPVVRRAGLPLLRALLPATVVGNAFLPGSLSHHRMRLSEDGRVRIEAGAAPELEAVREHVRRRLVTGLRRLGAWMLPGSFIAGAPGADLHYATTMPHALAPAPHECGLDGQVAGLPGVYLIDGAVLPLLPAKAHTLTLMANAHRIATALPA